MWTWEKADNYIALKIIAGTIFSGVLLFLMLFFVSLLIITNVGEYWPFSHNQRDYVSGRSAIPSFSFVTCWRIRKDKTTCSLWKYFERWKGSHKQLYLQSLKLVLHVCCWVLTLMYNVFAVKAPLLAYNSFAEAIFILNASLVHNGHADFQGSRV